MTQFITLDSEGMLLGPHHVCVFRCDGLHRACIGDFYLRRHENTSLQSRGPLHETQEPAQRAIDPEILAQKPRT